MDAELCVQTENLEMVYGEGSAAVRALRGIDLTIPQGQFVVVMGPSGSGKSTLLHLLAGLQQPTSGRICIHGAEIHKMSLDDSARWRRRNLGMVHQFFNLIPTLTLVQNIAMPLLLDGQRLTRLRDRVDELLNSLGMLDRRDHGLDQLSGGELQRIAIARALMAEPPLILADEPTGNLDTANGLEILRLFSNLSRDRGVTLIMMTHDRQATTYADRVILLRDGAIEEDSCVGPDLGTRVLES
jgi:putative ABC transport system ATP-binding protein